VGIPKGSAALQIPGACIRRNLPDWGAVFGVYFCTTTDSALPGSAHGKLWSLTTERFLRKAYLQTIFKSPEK
jgi:hypothetical protein